MERGKLQWPLASPRIVRARSRRSYERCAINGFVALHISIMRGILGQRLRNAGSPRAPTLRAAIAQCHLSLSLSLSLSSIFLRLPRNTNYLLPLSISLRFARWLPFSLCRVPPPSIRLYANLPVLPPPPSLVAIVRQCSLVSRCFRPTYPNVPFSLSLSLSLSLPSSYLSSLPADSLTLSLSCQPSAALSTVFSLPFCRSRPYGCIR